MADYKDSLKKFQKSLKALEEQKKLYDEESLGPPHKYSDSVKDALVQRFEVCFDCFWKYLKVYLEKSAVKNIGSSPKEVLKKSVESDLLPHPLQKWHDYHDLRNSTSHDYNEKKALSVIEGAGTFVADAIKIYEKLKGEKWG
ncbi:MAG: HI0074 family nucleotidyltransferase substrate-binding subunit [Bacteriovoracales bacterium]|nr:HI0074 family nucleotidyltransferase substrate-binding subunit [Bacteriovoracales bacterium]